MRTAMLIILLMLALTALGALAFAAWRLLANLRDLGRSLARAQGALAPGLAELSRQSQAAAERVATLQARRAGAGGDGSGGPRQPGRDDLEADQPDHDPDQGRASRRDRDGLGADGRDRGPGRPVAGGPAGTRRPGGR